MERSALSALLVTTVLGALHLSLVLLPSLATLAHTTLTVGADISSIAIPAQLGGLVLRSGSTTIPSTASLVSIVQTEPSKLTSIHVFPEPTQGPLTSGQPSNVTLALKDITAVGQQVWRHNYYHHSRPHEQICVF